MTTQKIQEFKLLSFEEKYQKVLAMLEILKEGDSLFGDFYELINNLKEETSEELLENIYSMIIVAIDELEKEDNEKELNKIKKLKEKMQKLKELEELQKKEENPDSLLENI